MIDYTNTENIDKEMIKSFYNEHKKDIYALINTIESEIRTIKNKIDFD